MSSSSKPSRKGLDSSFQNLSIDSKHKQHTKTTSTPVADSWDEEPSSSSDTEPSLHTTSDIPSAPPPTPISPRSRQSGTKWSDFPSSSTFSAQYAPDGSPISPASGRPGSPRTDARPEKTTAVAGRLIAGALGVKTPAKSDETRDYERVLKEKEQRRRRKEKEAKRREEDEREAAKKSVWEG